MILAIKDKDRVFLAASYNHYAHSGLMESDLLIYENSPFIAHPEYPDAIFAVSPSIKLKYSIEAHDFDIIDWNIKSIATRFIQELRRLSENIGYRESNETLGDHIIIADNQTIYDINDYFSVEDKHDFAMSYKVESIARSILNEKESLKPKDLIKEIFKATSKFTDERFFPFTMIDTKTREYKIVYE